MKLDTRVLVRAAVALMAVSFVICFLFVAIAPRTAMDLFGNVLHADLSGLARPVGIGSFVTGLVFWSVFVALCVGLTGWIYNRSAHA
jgi:cytochrome c biogenesis protein CcdA